MDEGEMGQVRNPLGRVSLITAESLGPPGQRHFQLLVEAEWGKGVLWLEKEQLYELGVAIVRLLAVLSEGAARDEERPLPGEPLHEASLDFKVGKLSLGHDRDRGLFVVMAQDIEAQEGEPATLSCWATRRQLESLADRAFKVCAAGRPRCNLCGTSMDPGEPHVCSRSNGHGILA